MFRDLYAFRTRPSAVLALAAAVRAHARDGAGQPESAACHHPTDSPEQPRAA